MISNIEHFLYTSGLFVCLPWKIFRSFDCFCFIELLIWVELLTKNYKTPIKEIQQGINKWKDISYSPICKTILLKCEYYQSNLSIQGNSIRDPMTFFREFEKTITTLT